MQTQEEAFFQLIYAILCEIPYGKVATYGQLAALAGRPSNARMVGKALRFADQYGDFPCHRVVNHKGRLAPGFFDQEKRLREEGIIFQKNGNVNLRICQWHP